MYLHPTEYGIILQPREAFDTEARIIPNWNIYERSNIEEVRTSILRPSFHQYITERQWQHVVTMVTLDPRNVSFLDWARKTPLHRVCECGAPPFVIRSFLRARSDPIQTDSYKRTPLHSVFSSTLTSNTHDIVRLLLSKCPRAARVEDLQKKLPFHKAVEVGASIETIELLLQVYPRAIHHRTEVITSLLEVQTLFQKLSLETRRILGSPLHWACERGLTHEIENALDIKSAMTVDGDGYLPLHIALKQNVAEKTLSKILRIYPDAACISFPESDNILVPLQLVCSPKPRGNHFSREIMIDVSDACRGSPFFKDILSVRNKNNETILHVICTSLFVPIEVLETIIQVCPFLINLKNYDGKTPFDLFIETIKLTMNSIEMSRKNCDCENMNKLSLLSGRIYNNESSIFEIPTSCSSRTNSDEVSQQIVYKPYPYQQ